MKGEGGFFETFFLNASNFLRVFGGKTVWSVLKEYFIWDVG